MSDATRAALVKRLRRLQRHFELVARTGAKHEQPIAVLDAETVREAADHLAAPVGEPEKAQLLDDLRAEYAEEHARGKTACDECEDCGKLVMCRFHSFISMLFGDTWTDAAIERDNARRRHP